MLPIVSDCLWVPLIACDCFRLLLSASACLPERSLNYWTGAEPAEHFSVRKRPAYAAYQVRESFR